MKHFIAGFFFLLLGMGLNAWSIRSLTRARDAVPPASVENHDDTKETKETPPPRAEPQEVPMPADSAAVSPAGGAAGMPPEKPADEAPAPRETEAQPPEMGENSPAPAGGESLPATPSQVVLLFAPRSQSISPALAQELTQLAKASPDAVFRMEVAAGEMKTADENEKLAKRRARAIRKVLTDAGIPERKVAYKLVLPGPDDGAPPKTSDEWRRATVRATRGK